MISNVFTLVLATATIANAFPLFRREAAPIELIRRAENSGQLAQGSNFYFQSLHIEDACTPGQVACVSGNYATCSGEANWEITPCSTGTTCFATPADSSSGVTVQCTTQDAATAEINSAGGDSNIAADFHVVNAPFHADTVPTATESSSAAPSPTETETPIVTESGSATETPAPTETCIPEEGDGEPEEDSTVSAPTEPTETETPSPTETCTEEPEEPLETETITVVLIPVPSQSGVYSTTTLFPSEATEAPSATESSSSASETAIPEPTPASDSAPASESTPAPSDTEAPYSYPSADPTDSDSNSDSAPADTATETDSSSTSTSIASAPTPSETVTSITLSFPADGSAPSIPPVNPGSSQPTQPPVVVVGIHFIPAAGAPAPSSTGDAPSPVVQVKRGMQKKIRRV